MRGRQLVVAALVGNLFAGAVHGWAHAAIPVEVPGWQYAVAGVVVFLVPLGATVLLYRGRPRVGLWLLALAGLTSTAVEGLLHFGVHNPDHVGTVGRGWDLFATTAGLTTLGDAVLLFVAGWVLWRHSKGTAHSRTETPSG